MIIIRFEKDAILKQHLPERELFEEVCLKFEDNPIHVTLNGDDNKKLQITSVESLYTLVSIPEVSPVTVDKDWACSFRQVQFGSEEFSLDLNLYGSENSRYDRSALLAGQLIEWIPLAKLDQIQTALREIAEAFPISCGKDRQPLQPMHLVCQVLAARERELMAREEQEKHLAWIRSRHEFERSLKNHGCVVVQIESACPDHPEVDRIEKVHATHWSQVIDTWSKQAASIYQTVPSREKIERSFKIC